RVRAVALLMPLLLVACAAPTPSPSGPLASPSAVASESPSSEPSVATSSPSATAASPSVDPTAGKERTDEHGVAQVWVPAGTFLMGTDETDPSGELAPPSWARVELTTERPQHEVALSSGYWIDKTEVTNAAYQAFVDAGGYQDKALWSDAGWTWLAGRDATALPAACVDAVADQPRVCVTWYEVEAYAKWRGGALPTEAQWEYAARGPSSSIFPWGADWDASKANVVDSDALTAVGSFPDGASWVGALDMAGNAMEWVADWHSPSYYKQKVRDDPTGPEFGSKKVEKGGWWGAEPYVARSAYRHFEDPPTYQDHHIGVRVVTVGEPPA
ncbi:MAG TPA: SUMF1/EgtB/PvdO family nonheme iron enzyme, partial [Candidatus Limnocylindrales bacterium]|nr:SUMF1/EgtB/PvdO family nonheme iron enzyme [Candidatus Limnocylindrales bacterium]